MSFNLSVPSNASIEYSLLPYESYKFSGNLIAIWNELEINLESIRDIEKALPETHNCLQELKRICTMVTDDPTEDARFEVINGGPNPYFVF